MRGRRFPAVIASALLCASCAEPIAQLPEISAAAVATEHRTEQIAQIRDYYETLARLDRVAFHIRVANRVLCAAQSAQIGMHAVTVKSLPRKFQSYSREALNVSSTEATVISVADGSPAAEAGIKTGDQVLTFDNEAVSAKEAPGWIGGILKENGERPVVIVLRRDGVDRTVIVQPVLACAIPINLVIDGSANAFTDYKKIVIKSGILRLTHSDADLAVIIGHELAHVNMGHYGKKLQNALLGAASGAAVDGAFMVGGIYTNGTFSKHFELAGARAFSVVFEREADYVGAYYAARAGYDISGAENVWRAMALEIAEQHPLRQDVPDLAGTLHHDASDDRRDRR